MLDGVMLLNLQQCSLHNGDLALGWKIASKKPRIFG